MSVPEKSPPVNPAQIYEDELVPKLFLPCVRELLRVAPPRPGDRVLDVACGTGIVLREAARAVPETTRLTGIDLNPRMIEVAREVGGTAGLDAEWHEASVESLPFEDKAFTVAYCQQGLQFFPDKQAALTELRRVLDDDGRLVTATWRSIDDHPFIKAINDIAYEHTGVNMLLDPFSLGDSTLLTGLFESAGFREVSLRQISLTSLSPNPERDERLQLKAAFAAIASLQQLPPEKQNEMIDTIMSHAMPVIEKYTIDGALTTEWHSNVIIARK